jgi:hypothetical protein
MNSKEQFSSVWNRRDRIQQARKFSLISATVTIVGVLLLTGLRGIAVEEKSLNEAYQAQAMGQSTQMGKTFNLTIHIHEYSTPEERQDLIDAFKAAGSKRLYNALDKMPAKGRIAITGTLGYDIHFARKLPTDEGIKLRVVTSRPINSSEAWYNGRSIDYNLSMLELNINKETGKGSGTLMPASKFKIDKKTGELTIETFQNPWKLVNIMDRSKE